MMTPGWSDGGGMVLGSSHVSETTRVPFLAPTEILTLLAVLKKLRTQRG